MSEDSYSGSNSDIDNDPATNPKNKNKEKDPAKNNDEKDVFSDDSLSGSIDNDDKKSNKSGGNNSEEEDEEDKKRNEVRKEFTLEFEKKIAKYIPPKIKFVGDLRKKSLVTMKKL